MPGISSGLMLGGALAVTVAGIGGYFLGRSAGADSVTVDWQEEQLKNKATQLQYERELGQLRVDLVNANNAITDSVRVEYVDRVKTITETKYQNRDVIKEVFRDTPFLSKGWVYAHNQLVDGAPIDPALASDRTPSTFTEEKSLDVISTNYSIARQAIAKDQGWNKFYAGVYDNYKLPAPDGLRNADSNSTSD